MYDLIIIGGGPAGITAGIFASRQKLNTLLITEDFGGQMAMKAVAIENYPGFKEISGLELVKKFKEHLKKQKIDIMLGDSVTKIKKINSNFLVFTKNKKRHRLQSRAVIVASGAGPKPLGIAGEKKFIGRGLSYCVSCDAPLFSDKVVAIIGGGNAGFEAAIALSKRAKRVYILEYGQKVKASGINQERVKASNKIEIITSAALKKIQGEKFVNSIIYQDLKTKRLKTLFVEGIFVEIGFQPATFFVKELVDFNKRNEIEINHKTCQTRTSGIFGAGDVTDIKNKQIVIACGQGAQAALSAYEYLENQK